MVDLRRVGDTLPGSGEDDADDAVLEGRGSPIEIAFRGQGERPRERAEDLLDGEVAVDRRHGAAECEQSRLAGELEILEVGAGQGSFDHDLVALLIDVDRDRQISLATSRNRLLAGQLLDGTAQRVGVVIHEAPGTGPSLRRL